jgi:hypothetical protein
MNQDNHFLSPRTLVEITDEEHALILMIRMMRLDEIICVMILNNFLPKELPNRFDHIMNIINLYFNKSYETHIIRTVIEFISTHPVYNEIFHHYSLDEMIQKYQKNRIAESDGINELYLKPYTTQCIQCKEQLTPTFSHRSKTAMSLVKTSKARM